MNSSPIRPVILCGGNGSRLWPLSRKAMPKQFARLSSKKSMLQETVLRLEDCGCSNPILMTANDHRFIVGEQLSEIGSREHTIVIEPDARNTAASICAASEISIGENPDALLLIAPADHKINDTLALSQAIAAGAEVARKGSIVVFGITPSRAETGFGYIELVGEKAETYVVQPILGFREKPEQSEAAEMVESGRFLWNSGMFLMTAQTARAAFGKYASKIRGAVRRSIRDGKNDLDFFRLSEAYSACPDVSFDVAIMEKHPGHVVPMDPGWTDMGTWRAVWNANNRDEDGVSTSGAALSISCSDTLLRSEDDAVQVVGVGLKNIAAIATRDAVLITDLDASQEVAKVVETLKIARAPQAESFHRQSRPWGHYETLALGQRFQVKSIVVKPGQKLSLQSHVHRAEHWVVVEGSGTVTIGAEQTLLAENQSIYVPLGAVHRLENPGHVDLRLIEVQTGAYLGEDDIVRYEDIYERA